MPIKDPIKSLATNKSDAMDLYFYRKSYRNNILTRPSIDGKEIMPGVVDLWYGRNLYGKINFGGDVVLLREHALDTLWTNDKKTLYALNFVALMFNEMTSYMRTNLVNNNIPNTNTVYKKLGAQKAWRGVYDDYHEYMISIYESFSNYLIDMNYSHRVKNFDDFMVEFFIFVRNGVVGKGYPLTLSSFITSNMVSNLSSGLIIDLFDANSADDANKIDRFVNDVNHDFFRHAATFHGFVVDKNMPWRLVANLSSERMQKVMELLEFDVTYEQGPKNIFKKYYTKTHMMDLVFLRNYSYMIYKSLTQENPAFEKSFICGKTNKFVTKLVPVTKLTEEQKESYTTKDYWMEKYYRFRLLELKHDLTEENIISDVQKAQSVYKYRGENRAINFLYKKTKKYFLNQYNQVNLCMWGAPILYSDFIKKSNTTDSH